ncbi:50S ribosomal protein L17 [Buchnera aphidicola (Pemphigus obesinymphae)]|uniref:50S ribosomal protein L17 n=1 Tax=Buchnera aphidicola TaxID=9 RepID=UPI0022372085|nr:50S ribosomal protein L17 [Buchnera aphidicola]MCW5196395.1 50S ribosomal protein L17 [Buchnera aphidicola (Pemphigus obesinymphae)]
MRHRKISFRLNRSPNHIKAMFRNMICSLLHHELIRTTVAKAKILRRIIEPLITKSRVDNVKNRRFIFSKIRNNEMVDKLFTDLGPFFLNRTGGYIRVLKFGFRAGDRSPIAYVQFVDRKKEKSKIVTKK